MPVFKRPVNQSFLVPEGIYVAQVIGAETRIAETSGNTYHRLRLVLWPGSYRLSTRLVFSQRARRRFSRRPLIRRRTKPFTGPYKERDRSQKPVSDAPPANGTELIIQTGGRL